VILWTVWGRSVPKVVASRLSRIYPAYWTALALTVFLLMVLWPAGKQISWGEVAVNVTLLQEPFGVRHVDGVYWTLWAELRFYLLIVVLVAIGLTRRRVLAFAALWPAAALAADVFDWGFLQTLLISRYAPLFAGGMLLFLIYRDGHARAPWLILGGNVVLAVHNIVPAQMRSLTRNTMWEPNPWLLGVLTVGCFATVALVALTPLRKISWAPLATLGALTYPLYLIHQFWGWWAIDRLDPRLPTYVVLGIAMILSVALAAFIHYAVEQRWTPVARRWIEARLTAVGERLRAPRGSAVGGADEVPAPALPVFSDAAVEAVFSNTYTAAEGEREGRGGTLQPAGALTARRR
jgi:peptidoglycan/LPS O-acetylase OafA/YrhL